MRTMKINGRLLHLAQYIERSDSFNNAVHLYHENGEPSCIGGHAIEMFRSEHTEKEFDDAWKLHDYHAEEFIAAILGITKGQVIQLIHRSHLLNIDKYRWRDNRWLNVFDCQRALLNLAETGKVNWHRTPRIEWTEDYIYYG